MNRFAVLICAALADDVGLKTLKNINVDSGKGVLTVKGG